jgi:hypothetical protein
MATNLLYSVASLEQLPDDIKLFVLEQLIDVRAFQNLLEASPSFKSLYDSERRHVLTAFLGSAILVHPDVLATLQSSMMMGTSEEARRTEMKEFMEAKYGANSAPVDLKTLLPKNIPLAAVNRMLSVHKGGAISN